MPAMTPEMLETLRQLSDRALLARHPLDTRACEVLEAIGLLTAEDGYWRLSRSGRAAISDDGTVAIGPRPGASTSLPLRPRTT
ncbi:hypothetical protein ABIE56_002362 [Luteibacter sp. 621]